MGETIKTGEVCKLHGGIAAAIEVPATSMTGPRISRGALSKERERTLGGRGRLSSPLPFLLASLPSSLSHRWYRAYQFPLMSL